MKSYVDLNQARKLAEILPLESADMCYIKGKAQLGFLYEEYKELGDTVLQDYEPCWSLSPLLSVLPILERKGYQKAKPQLLYNVAINKWIVDSHIYTTDAYDNLVDACYEMIVKLHELNLLVL
jgi:hypothetical protein